ncbi:hypothetical protein DFH11DRAFT_1626733 [Phellopilus nigrolimitatus]|nr:hypothetical protein DFH11DRAFT_1626733 [Phellopilus nigrolimitatus]
MSSTHRRLISTLASLRTIAHGSDQPCIMLTSDEASSGNWNPAAGVVVFCHSCDRKSDKYFIFKHCVIHVSPLQTSLSSFLFRGYTICHGWQSFSRNKTHSSVHINASPCPRHSTSGLRSPDCSGARHTSLLSLVEADAQSCHCRPILLKKIRLF